MVPPDDRHLPDLSFAFYDRMVVFDNITKTITVVAMLRLDDESQAGKQCDCRGGVCRCSARDRRDDREAQPGRQPIHTGSIELAGDPQLSYRSNFRQDEFEGRCESASSTSKRAIFFRW